eukprot:763290-Amphidinium_carterae.1
MSASGVLRWQLADATDLSLRPGTGLPKCGSWLSLQDAKSEVAGAAAVASEAGWRNVKEPVSYTHLRAHETEADR